MICSYNLFGSTRDGCVVAGGGVSNPAWRYEKRGIGGRPQEYQTQLHCTVGFYHVAVLSAGW